MPLWNKAVRLQQLQLRIHPEELSREACRRPQRRAAIRVRVMPENLQALRITGQSQEDPQKRSETRRPPNDQCRQRQPKQRQL